MGSGNMYLVGKHLVSWDCKMCKTVCVLVCNMELVCDMEFWNDQWIKQKTGKNWPSVNRQAWGKGWGGVEGVFICIESGKWAVILISCMSNKVIVRICCALWAFNFGDLPQASLCEVCGKGLLMASVHVWLGLSDHQDIPVLFCISAFHLWVIPIL